MANLFSGAPKVIPEFTGLQVNTSVQVLPIPIIYGTPRTSVNLLYYNGFQVKQVSQGGGKGILSGGKGAQETEYFATIILGISEGPVGGPLLIYEDQEVWTPATFPSNGAYYFNGTATQAPWSFVSSTWPTDARPYKNTAYYAFSNAQLDSSATVPQINLLINGFFATTCPLYNTTLNITSGQYDQNGKPLSFIGPINVGDMDADPAQCIFDFLTNATYGATFPTAFVDQSTLFTTTNGYNPAIGDQALSTFCQAVGLGWSVALNNAESANSILERWCKNLNVAIVWNGALLRFLPYWDTYVGTNPGWDSTNGIAQKYFNPFTVPITTITMDHVLQSSDKAEDPIKFSRKDPLEVYNSVRVDFSDRNNFFNNVALEVKDEAHIERFGPRIDNIGLASEFTLSGYAAMAAQMQLQRNISVTSTYTWKMSPLWAWLDPMEIYLIPDPVNYANTILVRIISVEDDEDETITVVAENLPLGSQSPTLIPPATSTPPNQGATNGAPASIYPPVLFAPTSALLSAQGFTAPQAIFGCSAGFGGTLDGNWGGVNVFASLDGVNYSQVATQNGPSTIGYTTATLGAYSSANPDTTHTLYVNLAESNGTLASVSSALAASAYSLCVIQDASGFELLSYTTATLVSSSTYALTGLYRGLYGTTARQFGAGSEFMLISSAANFEEYSLSSAYVGQTIYVKAQSFNVFRSALQDLSTCQVYTYMATSPTPAAPSVPPMQAANYRRGKEAKIRGSNLVNIKKSRWPR